MNLDDKFPAFIAGARELLEEMGGALRSIESVPEHVDTIVSIFHAPYVIHGSAGLFSLDQIAIFTQLTERMFDSLRAKKRRISCDVESLLPGLLDQLSVLMDVKMLCELAAHFDRVDDFSRMAQRLLGTARHEKLSASLSLEAILRGVLDPLRELIHLQVIGEHANCFSATSRRAALVTRGMA